MSITLPRFVLVLIASGGALAATPDAEPHDIEARFVSSPPAIDGVLDDDAWRSGPLQLGTWITYNPLFGEQMAQTSQVWVAYDRQYLYFAFRCVDPDPDKIKTAVSRRDTQWNDDWVGLSLDSIGSRQSAYDMFVNPSGIQGDILTSSTAGESTAVDWIWDSAARRTERGYDVEIRLPLKSIRFPGGAEVKMGILFWRRVSRLGMSASWPSLPPGKSRFTRCASLTLHDLDQPLRLELMPNVTSSWNQERAAPNRWAGGKFSPDAGLTMKYGINSSVTLDGTFRPDFSQVESDAYQVEVNQRYPIFYSEKRPFFMEGMGMFELAGSGGDANMRTAVHTRRIIDPLFGAKLTGTAGKFNFATLSASDQAPGQGDVTASLAGKDKIFNIGRAIYSLNEGSYVGGLVVDTQFGPGFNRVAAGDASLHFGEHLFASSTLIGTQTKDAETLERVSGTGAQLSFGYNSKKYNASVQAEHYGTGFRMDTAFYNREGFSGGNAYFARNYYPDAKRFPWFKKFVIFAFTTGGLDRPQDGDEAFGLVGVRFNFTRQGFFRVDGGGGRTPWLGREFPNRMARIMGNAQLYRWLYLDGRIEFRPRAVYYDAEAPFSGTQRRYSINTTLQPSAKVNQQVSLSRDTFDRLAGAGRVYAVNIVNSKTTYQFDKRFSVRAIARYDSSRRRILTDLLGAWEFSPGTVAYVGYGGLYERRGWDGESWTDQGDMLNTRRGFFFKISYLYRL